MVKIKFKKIVKILQIWKSYATITLCRIFKIMIIIYIDALVFVPNVAYWEH